MKLPSGLVYTEVPEYELRARARRYSDFLRGGGFKGDSELALQIRLARMEFYSNTLNDEATNHLSRLIRLEEIFSMPGGQLEESQIKTPYDLESKLEKYNI